jgi:hypothetical protein
MVIKYDDVQPHLDELEVEDKREQSKTTKSSSDGSSNTTNDTDGDTGSPTHSVNEREKIYQRGTAGLKEIKKARLENWLGTSEGVGSQTEQRILMVFQRNESVSRNPHVLYNLLDDELSASASYLNTMVQDIFVPEEEHGDLLQSQGYTPWYNRGASQPSQQMGQNMGGPMNATGSTGFSPNQNFGSPDGQPQPDGNNGGSQGDPGQDTMTRSEAEVMMRQAMEQASDNDERNALLSGLSNATDEALQEMATNVGGLAGTIQKVVDEALVGYARENPQWVIENMDILQKVIGATDDMPGSDDGSATVESKQDKKVDNALDNIASRQTSGSTPTVAQSPQQTKEPQQADPNPDLKDEHLDESGFDIMSASPDDPSPDEQSKPEPKPTPGEVEASKSEEIRQKFESDDGDSGEEDDTFDEIFGDLQ